MWAKEAKIEGKIIEKLGFNQRPTLCVHFIGYMIKGSIKITTNYYLMSLRQAFKTVLQESPNVLIFSKGSDVFRVAGTRPVGKRSQNRVVLGGSNIPKAGGHVHDVQSKSNPIKQRLHAP